MLKIVWTPIFETTPNAGDGDQSISLQLTAGRSRVWNLTAPSCAQPFTFPWNTAQEEIGKKGKKWKESELGKGNPLIRFKESTGGGRGGKPFCSTLLLSVRPYVFKQRTLRKFSVVFYFWELFPRHVENWVHYNFTFQNHFYLYSLLHIIVNNLIIYCNIILQNLYIQLFC